MKNSINAPKIHMIPNIKVNNEKLIFLDKSNKNFKVKIPNTKAKIKAIQPPCVIISGFLK